MLHCRRVNLAIVEGNVPVSLGGFPVKQKRGDVYRQVSGWWFQTFFIFHNIWDVILPID